jgi:DNA polymerase (family 10)
VDQGEDLDRLPGIGPDLAGKIKEIVATGSCAQLERLRNELPPAITELLKIPGLGPKRVRALHQELGIQTLELDHLRFGIGQARRSGLEADDVLNTRTQQAPRPLLDASMSRGARIPEHASGAQQALEKPGIH